MQPHKTQITSTQVGIALLSHLSIALPSFPFQQWEKIPPLILLPPLTYNHTDAILQFKFSHFSCKNSCFFRQKYCVELYDIIYNKRP